jgi:hypothetical protein
MADISVDDCFIAVNSTGYEKRIDTEFLRTRQVGADRIAHDQ